MKHKFLKKLIAVSVTISTLITLAPIGVSAAWVKNYYGNWSYTEGYSYATGWRQISGAWYYFDDYGQMITGWVSSNGEWYYMDSSGVMQSGVIQIEGKIYTFAQNGAMQRGYNVINGILYNFDDNGVCISTEVPMPSKGFDYYGNSTLPYIPSQIISESTKMSSDIPSDGSEPVVEYEVKFKDPDNEEDEEEDDDDELLKTRIIEEDTKMLLYKPKKSGYKFVEWNTKSSGSGTSYSYDESIKITKDLTLYAQWEVDDTTVDEETIDVETIVVTGTNGVKQITTAGGTLQMTKKVYPSDATDQTVTWTVSNDSGSAYISASGKLTAVSNGEVTVKATAKDGSGVSGEIVITISGQ